MEGDFTKMFKTISIFLVAFLSSAGLALASPLGVASDYNEFIFGNINQSGTDSEGRVAAGGAVNYSSMSVAANVKTTPSIGDLVVGGNLNFSEGSVGYLKDNADPAYQKGSIYVGGIATIAPTVGYGSLTYATPIDFNAAQNYLTQSSLSWGGLASNGNVSTQSLGNGALGILLTGYDSNLNVFHLSGADVILANAGNFKIDIPKGATALVNIDGTISAMQNFGFFFPDDKFDWDPYILYNFYQATSLTFGAIEIHGSVLAPYANVDFSDGHIEGQLIAMSLKGTGEAHDEYFVGQIPVPETATLLLLGGGFIAVAFWRKRGHATP
jgi:choice-of-anchor A domain-containing protein